MIVYDFWHDVFGWKLWPCDHVFQGRESSIEDIFILLWCRPLNAKKQVSNIRCGVIAYYCGMRCKRNLVVSLIIHPASLYQDRHGFIVKILNKVCCYTLLVNADAPIVIFIDFFAVICYVRLLLDEVLPLLVVRGSFIKIKSNNLCVRKQIIFPCFNHRVRDESEAIWPRWTLVSSNIQTNQAFLSDPLRKHKFE